jgi:hypothetical protein
VQILDSSTTDAHVFHVHVNASSPSPAPTKNPNSFDAEPLWIWSYKVIMVMLDTNHKDESLVWTFFGASTDSHVDTAGRLSEADTSPQVDPLMRTWEIVCGGHMPDGDCLLGSSASGSAVPGSSLVVDESPSTLDPIKSDSVPVHASSPGSSVAGSSAPETSVASPVPVRPNTCLQQGIDKPKVYMDGTVRYGLFTASDEPRNHQEALCDSR